MRISDWSSDVCSSDLQHDRDAVADRIGEPRLIADQLLRRGVVAQRPLGQGADQELQQLRVDPRLGARLRPSACRAVFLRFAHCASLFRSEEHTSELQSLMRISYAVFCLKKNRNGQTA